MDELEPKAVKFRRLPCLAEKCYVKLVGQSDTDTRVYWFAHILYVRICQRGVCAYCGFVGVSAWFKFNHNYPKVNFVF